MKRKSGARPPGQLRRSQVITTFGPGAMVDLPNHSVLIAGLDFWSAGGEEISEPRLSSKLATLLEVPSIRLQTPPAAEEDPTLPQTGIVAFQFPEWFMTQDVETGGRESTGRSRMLVHRNSQVRGKFLDANRRKRAVVPVRFVRACRFGHVGDIDWYTYAHRGATECRRQLWIDERGTSGDLSESWIRCDCGKAERSLTEMISFDAGALGLCDGARPWLGQYNTRELCNAPSRYLLRNASNAYFPQNMTVISLPDRDDTVRTAVDAAWEFLEAVEDLGQLQYERRKAKVKAALDGISDEEALREIESRRLGTPRIEKNVKLAELETLMASQDELGEDQPDGNFFARALPRPVWDQPWMQSIERVVLVHRLREVVAQVGFTRFSPPTSDINGELDLEVKRAALAREISWLPAVESRGVGFFLQFRREAIDAWLARAEVQRRGRVLLGGFDLWRAEHQRATREFCGLPYLMLHSLSHLLITSISLECGYPASSIRERIYAMKYVGYGILLYTGSPDAEGRLGGIIQVGRRIHEHLRNALELGELCSNDPVCAQHDAQNPHERRFLHGAACHGCLLIAETSCEQQNDFLDRALVVPTVDNLGVEFFPRAT
ncbi:MAG: DrmB family protein [Planctomycetaceae bacterium]